jgi:hypothetical protein
MITVSIFWTLVLILFRTSHDSSQEQQAGNKGAN